MIRVAMFWVGVVATVFAVMTGFFYFTAVPRLLPASAMAAGGMFLLLCFLVNIPCEGGGGDHERAAGMAAYAVEMQERHRTPITETLNHIATLHGDNMAEKVTKILSEELGEAYP